MGLQDLEIVLNFVIGGVAVDEDIEADALALRGSAGDEGGGGVLLGCGGLGLRRLSECGEGRKKSTSSRWQRMMCLKEKWWIRARFISGFGSSPQRSEAGEGACC